MGWQDLLASDDEIIVPWVGGKHLRCEERGWDLIGDLPVEHGWCKFKLAGQKARFCGFVDFDEFTALLKHQVLGYLAGDRLISDEFVESIDEQPERVHLIEAGLDRFARIRAGRVYEDGPLIFLNQEMQLGPENEILDYFLNGDNELPVKRSIRGATPALYIALELEIRHRVEVERRRAELEKRRREEEERRAKEERRKELVEKLGDGAGRRQMAQVDFAEAARAALVIGGAEYLDHRKAPRKNEMVVLFRLDGRRFECVCDSKLQVIDSGICLTAHDDDGDFADGTKGDTWFTLESLPSVIRQAQRENKLVVYRHVG